MKTAGFVWQFCHQIWNCGNFKCDALHDLVPFAQSKNHEKQGRSVTFSKSAG